MVQQQFFISACDFGVTSFDSIQCGTFSVFAAVRTTPFVRSIYASTIYYHLLASSDWYKAIDHAHPKRQSTENYVEIGGRRDIPKYCQGRIGKNRASRQSFQSTLHSVPLQMFLVKSIFVLLRLLIIIYDNALLGCLLGGHEASLDGLPINDTPNVLDIIGSHIAVIDIIRVFPNILQ